MILAASFLPTAQDGQVPAPVVAKYVQNMSILVGMPLTIATALDQLIRQLQSSQQQARRVLGAQGGIVLAKGAGDEAREDLAHAQPRLAQPHVAPHDLRVAALLPQLRELPHHLRIYPADRALHCQICALSLELAVSHNKAIICLSPFFHCSTGYFSALCEHDNQEVKPPVNN